MTSSSIAPTYSFSVPLERLSELPQDILVPGDRMYLVGEVGAGKTTLARMLIPRFLAENNTAVTSPTYTYYTKYSHNLYHFDLYRVESYDQFVFIGWEEVFDSSGITAIIEWPEIIAEAYPPTVCVDITIPNEGANERIFTITRFSWPEGYVQKKPLLK